jgi:uncharacterized protein (TIGR01244 family)
MFRKVTDTFYAAPQISAADVTAAKERGITLIINNRPDGEEPSAPQGRDIAAAANAAGIAYIAIPVTHAGFSRPQIDAMMTALKHADGKVADGKVLAYCRSGTRSTLLWALAQAASGESPRVIAIRAEEAGYDVSPIAMMIDALAASGSGAKTDAASQ